MTLFCRDCQFHSGIHLFVQRQLRGPRTRLIPRWVSSNLRHLPREPWRPLSNSRCHPATSWGPPTLNSSTQPSQPAGGCDDQPRCPSFLRTRFAFRAFSAILSSTRATACCHSRCHLPPNVRLQPMLARRSADSSTAHPCRTVHATRRHRVRENTGAGCTCTQRDCVCAAPGSGAHTGGGERGVCAAFTECSIL